MKFIKNYIISEIKKQIQHDDEERLCDYITKVILGDNEILKELEKYKLYGFTGSEESPHVIDLGYFGEQIEDFVHKSVKSEFNGGDHHQFANYFENIVKSIHDMILSEVVDNVNNIKCECAEIVKEAIQIIRINPQLIDEDDIVTVDGGTKEYEFVSYLPEEFEQTNNKEDPEVSIRDGEEFLRIRISQLKLVKRSQN